MLSRLLKDHQAKQSKLREENEQKRKEALTAVNVVTNVMLDNINTGVAHVFANQRKLEHETQVLQQQTKRFSKQTTQWLQLIDNFNTALKEIGDVENWSKSIENDMKSIVTSLEYIQKPMQQ